MRAALSVAVAAAIVGVATSPRATHVAASSSAEPGLSMGDLLLSLCEQERGAAALPPVRSLDVEVAGEEVAGQKPPSPPGPPVVFPAPLWQHARQGRR